MRMIIIIVCLLILWPVMPAYAYIGPGLGLGVIGAIFGFIMSIVLAIMALVWYPLKRLFGIGKKRRKNKTDSFNKDSDTFEINE